jgi:hypothetical protein
MAKKRLKRRQGPPQNGDPVLKTEDATFYGKTTSETKTKEKRTHTRGPQHAFLLHRQFTAKPREKCTRSRVDITSRSAATAGEIVSRRSDSLKVER